jgi:DNA replication licensing factor MCM7
MLLHQQIDYVINMFEIENYNNELAMSMVNNIVAYVDLFDMLIRKRLLDPLKILEVSVNASSDPMSIRDIDANYIGKLVKFDAIVVLASSVNHRIVVATYTCDICGFEFNQEVNTDNFMLIAVCPSVDCSVNKSGGLLNHHTRKSKFIDFQCIKLREHTNRIAGGAARSYNVIFQGGQTNRAQIGTHVIISGVLLPSVHNELNTSTFIRAYGITTVTEVDFKLFTPDEIKLLSCEDIYTQLAASILPELTGMLDIKKSLILLLVGGVDKNIDITMRGIMHMALIGDPGLGKSMLLTYISNLFKCPEYTTGRGSSTAGLTAAVVRDHLTGDWTLEAGAVIRANGGKIQFYRNVELKAVEL